MQNPKYALRITYTRQVVLFHQCFSFCCATQLVWFNDKDLFATELQPPKMRYAWNCLWLFSFSSQHQINVKSSVWLKCVLFHNYYYHAKCKWIENPAALSHIAFFHYAIHIKTICSINYASERTTNSALLSNVFNTISLNLPDYFAACSRL